MENNMNWGDAKKKKKKGEKQKGEEGVTQRK